MKSLILLMSVAIFKEDDLDIVHISDCLKELLLPHLSPNKGCLLPELMLQPGGGGQGGISVVWSFLCCSPASDPTPGNALQVAFPLVNMLHGTVLNR